MLETMCPDCHQRYPLGQDHVCPKPAKLERANPPKQAESDDTSKPVARSNAIPPKRAKRNEYMRKYMANRRAAKLANTANVNTTPEQKVNTL